MSANFLMDVSAARIELNMTNPIPTNQMAVALL
jgi:hypothetical protein